MGNIFMELESHGNLMSAGLHGPSAAELGQVAQVVGPKDRDAMSHVTIPCGGVVTWIDSWAS